MAEIKPSRPARAAATAPGRVLPDKIKIKQPNGSIVEVPVGQLTDPELVEDMEMFRSTNTGLVANGPIIKKVQS